MSQVPANLPYVTQDFFYSSFKSREEAIDKAAEYVAPYFSYFLTPKAHEEEALKLLSEKGVWIENGYQNVREFPSNEEVINFHRILKETVCSELKEPGSDIVLSTDYSPEKILDDVFKSAGITRKRYRRFPTFFPAKSNATIEDIKNENRIRLNINFRF